MSDLIDFRALHLLVVDDNPQEFVLLEAGFSARGYPVVFQTTTIGHLAVVELAMCDEETRPEIALVDINMPAIDGFSLAKEFIGNGLPTILMSSLIDPQRRARAASLGVLDLLEKPDSVQGYSRFADRVLSLAGRC